MAPKHVGFIMDGNGRWATARDLPRTDGYKEGLVALKRAVTECERCGVEVVSVYAFSTENNARPDNEIAAIFEVVKSFNLSYDGDWKILYMGDIDALPDDIAYSVTYVEQKTAQNSGITLNIALNYGGRDDIAHACKLAFDHSDFTERAFESYLSSAGLPPLDLIVRTGGEKRLSNFMLFEAAYSELVFLDIMWCDVTEATVDEVLAEYESRIRKFGK